MGNRLVVLLVAVAVVIMAAFGVYVVYESIRLGLFFEALPEVMEDFIDRLPIIFPFSLFLSLLILFALASGRRGGSKTRVLPSERRR
jgi:hypothetical protein